MALHSSQIKYEEVPKAAGIIQFDVVQGHYKKNLSVVKGKLAELSPCPGSIIVLPELWATGFDYKNLPALAETTPELLDIIQEEAARYDIIIAGSLIESVNIGSKIIYHNSLFFTDSQGSLGQYRKQQLFEPMAEDQHFTAGREPLPVHSSKGIFAGLVCYDLRFPEIAASQVSRGAKVIIVTAQWPAARLDHWQTLLKARAIENQAFVVACNRSGISNDIKFAGHSSIIGPDGTIMFKAGAQEEVGQIQLDPQHIKITRGLFNTASPTPYRFNDQNKIVPLPQLISQLNALRSVGKKVCFTNGCFDILHQGHVTYLEEARKKGDLLILGLNSDSSIRSIKGPDRPINSEASRARVLAALACVDYIVLFSDDTPLSLITTIMPDVLVKGDDWPIEQIAGAQEVLANGGQVVTIPMVPNFSTTGLIDDIKNE